MLRLALLLSVAGCSFVWDPDGYVGESDVGPADAGDAGDTDVGPEDGAMPDTPADSMPEDAENDTSADVGFDVLDAGMCTLTEMRIDNALVLPGEVMGDSLTDTRITFSGIGPAIIINDANFTLANVELILTNPGATGISVNTDADFLTLRNVRVSKLSEDLAADPSESRVALELPPGSATAADPLTGLTVDNFEVFGMEGIHLHRAISANLTRVQIIDPRGAGATVGVHTAIDLQNCNGVELDEFVIKGEAPNLGRALRVVDSDDVNIRNGTITVPARIVPLRIEGVAPGFATNQIVSVGVTNSGRGVELLDAQRWEMQDVNVVRPASCGPGDFAYTVRSSDVSCPDCRHGSFCALEPLSMDMAYFETEPGAVIVVRPPLSFCFARMGAF